MAPTTGTLASIVSTTPGVISVDDATVALTDVTHDSRAAQPGTLFVAIDGMTTDGHRFVPSAVDAGATAVMVSREVETSVPTCVVADTRQAMAHVAAEVHGRPADAMTMVGVTGTNGKTTVGAMCESILRVAQRSTGIVGTLGARIDGAPIPLKRTTPESSDLQRLLGSMRDRGVDVVVMEVSSHALDLHRADAIEFEVAGFTNLSQDHLDFHGDMEAYFAAKAKLFEVGRTRHAVVNVGDPAGQRIASRTDVPMTTVGVDMDADVRATIVAQSSSSLSFVIDAGGDPIDITMPLAGSFNVANAAVAFGICQHIGCDEDSIVEGLSSLSEIPGRMESIEPEADITVIVDFAHTPAAVSTVVEAASHMGAPRVITVVGAGGDRDPEKRPMMGAAAARHSAVTVVTSDNPRSEDPKAIVDAVANGAQAAATGRVEQIVDRAEAIAAAVAMAEPGDIVLILGRGHEPEQEVGGAFIPFLDADVARKALAARGGGQL